MIWFNSIYDLQYYHQPKGVPCYCEAIAYPQDMHLQGQFYQGNNNYTLKIYVYSADGQTQYEDATAYFDYYFAAVPNTTSHFFNARLKSFSPEMCAHECYILRAEVTQNDGRVVFNKYTERYCQNNCCDVPRNIQIDQTGFQPLVLGSDTTVNGTVIGTSPQIYIPAGDCGELLVRIISTFDCIDNFTGDFYGRSNTTISGVANFEYKKITTFKGRIVRRPREIQREISYNCRVLRSESAAQFLLEGFELMPSWKMYEIEGQLHANRIYIDDMSAVREYRFTGGTVMRQLSKCFELFKLEAKLEDCTQRQVFGCDADCSEQLNFDGSHAMYAIPANYSGGQFFNSTGEAIADDYNGLIDYLRTRDGVTATNDVDTTSLNCTVHKVVSVTTSGQPDTHLYYDAPTTSNKVKAVVVNDINELCNYLPVICTAPALGAWDVTIPVCAAPVDGMFTVEDTDTDVVAMIGYEDWIDDEVITEASIYNREVAFTLKVVNGTITEDPAYPDEDVYVQEVIGIVGANGRPSTMIVLDSTNSSVPEEVSLTIDTNGQITYYGPVTSADEFNVTIQLNNIKYNI